MPATETGRDVFTTGREKQQVTNRLGKEGIMKYFPKPQRGNKCGVDHGITSHPENSRLEGIKRMILSGGVSRLFAQPLAEAQKRALHENQNNNNEENS